MSIKVVNNCNNVEWRLLMQLLGQSGMGTYTPTIHKHAFENSYRTVFLYDDTILIGCGRLLSDGAYQGALYDIAIDEQYRGKGLGTKLVEELINGLEQINIMLYASPGKEPFYTKLGFSPTKTGMVKFTNAKAMKEKGFI